MDEKIIEKIITKIKTYEKKTSSNGKTYWYIEDQNGERYTAWFDADLKVGNAYELEYEVNGNFKNIKIASELDEDTQIPAPEIKIHLPIEEILAQRLEKAIKIVCKEWDCNTEYIMEERPELISQITGIMIGLGRD